MKQNSIMKSLKKKKMKSLGAREMFLKESLGCKCFPITLAT